MPFVFMKHKLPEISGNSRSTGKVAGLLLLCLSFLISLPCTATGLMPPNDREQYRRSSLCLILLTHRDKKYADAMERVFRSFPLPARYNEHNISDLRVISVKGKQSKRDIDRIVNSQMVAKRIVGRWFNRSYDGTMNMDLIHQRGGYGAFYNDYLMAENTVRGTDMLRDEGIELLQSTFLLVCDMDYIDKKKGFRIGSILMGIASVVSQGLAAYSNIQAYSDASHGDYSSARRHSNQAAGYQALGAVTAVGSEVMNDLGGFRVKMKAYLYKLNWNDELTQTMYNELWADNTMSYTDISSRAQNFEEHSSLFTLEYLGDYKATSSKTILRSWSNEDEVILDVCERCVNKGMKALAKTFPIFRPRAPFYFDDGGVIYSHIGTKEDVTRGAKYEILQPYRDKNGQIAYKRVGKARAGAPWDNREVSFDQYFDERNKGTMFYCKGSSIDLHTPGLQLRELL